MIWISQEEAEKKADKIIEGAWQTPGKYAIIHGVLFYIEGSAGDPIGKKENKKDTDD